MDNATRSTQPRVVVVGYWAAGSSVADGFVQRNARVIESLRHRHEVLAIALGSPLAQRAVDYDVVINEARDSEVASRLARLCRALKISLGRLGRNRAERRLRREVAAAHPDVIIALLRRRPELVELVADLAPTAFFAEEQAGRLAAPTWSGVPPIFSLLLHRGRRGAAQRASVAVVLTDSEKPSTQQALGLDTVVVPHAFELDYWATPVAPALEAGPCDVLMVANCTLERNARPVIEVIDELDVIGWPSGLRLRIVSDPGYTPELLARRSATVDLVGSVVDLRPHYKSAKCVLVPDFQAEGVKNGIVQGWATRTPVVAAAPSANTVDGVDGIDLLCGDSPSELALILTTLAQRDGLDVLSTNGYRSVHERFSTAAHDRALAQLVERLTRQVD